MNRLLSGNHEGQDGSEIQAPNDIASSTFTRSCSVLNHGPTDSVLGAYWCRSYHPVTLQMNNFSLPCKGLVGREMWADFVMLALLPLINQKKPMSV